MYEIYRNFLSSLSEKRSSGQPSISDGGLPGESGTRCLGRLIDINWVEWTARHSMVFAWNLRTLRLFIAAAVDCGLQFNSYCRYDQSLKDLPTLMKIGGDNWLSWQPPIQYPLFEN